MPKKYIEVIQAMEEDNQKTFWIGTKMKISNFNIFAEDSLLLFLPGFL